MLIATIQNEAELAQRLVDMITSTKSMRRRKELCGDLTYRRRSQRAKQSLYSYAPRAPTTSNWGDIFDDMMDELRGRQKSIQREQTTCAQCDNGSVYDNYDSSSSTEHNSIVGALLHQPDLHNCKVSGNTATHDCNQGNSDRKGDNSYSQLTETQPIAEQCNYKGELPRSCDCSVYLDSSIPRQLLHSFTSLSASIHDLSLSENDVCEQTTPTSSPNVLRERPTLLECGSHPHSNAHVYWEENWSGNPTLPSEPALSCNGGCDNLVSDMHTVVKPFFCYKNQRCASFGISSSSELASDQVHTSAGADDSMLHCVSFRRQELSSFTLPLSPIRKTDSGAYIILYSNCIIYIYIYYIIVCNE